MVLADKFTTSVKMCAPAALPPISPVAVNVAVVAVMVPEVLVMASAAVRLIVPVTEKLESMIMSLPAPVVVRLMLGALMPAPAVVRVPPAVRSNNVPAPEAPRLRPEVSVMNTFAPVVFAVRFTTSVKM